MFTLDCSYFLEANSVIFQNPQNCILKSSRRIRIKHYGASLIFLAHKTVNRKRLVQEWVGEHLYQLVEAFLLPSGSNSGEISASQEQHRAHLHTH